MYVLYLVLYVGRGCVSVVMYLLYCMYYCAAHYSTVPSNQGCIVRTYVSTDNKQQTIHNKLHVEKVPV